MITRIVKPILLGAALALGTTSVAFAQPAKPKPAAAVSQSVTVKVQVVHATNAHSDVDGSLRALERQLRFLNFTGFRSLDTRSESLSTGERTSVSVAGGREMKITLIEVDDTAAKLRVQLYKGSAKTVDTTVSVHRNRSFIVAGPKHDDGVLVFPLTASY